MKAGVVGFGLCAEVVAAGLEGLVEPVARGGTQEAPRAAVVEATISVNGNDTEVDMIRYVDPRYCSPVGRGGFTR